MSDFGQIHTIKDKSTKLAVAEIVRFLVQRVLNTQVLGESFEEGDIDSVERFFLGQREGRRVVVRQSGGDGPALEIHSNGEPMISLEADTGFSGGDYLEADMGAKLTAAGVWTDGPCSYAKKMAVRGISNDEIAEKVKKLPVFEFEHRKEPGVKRIGPTVEDLWDIFRVGSWNSISARDLAGIAIRAVQCALSRIEELEAKVERLEEAHGNR